MFPRMDRHIPSERAVNSHSNGMQPHHHRWSIFIRLGYGDRFSAGRRGHSFRTVWSIQTAYSDEGTLRHSLCPTLCVKKNKGQRISGMQFMGCGSVGTWALDSHTLAIASRLFWVERSNVSLVGDCRYPFPTLRFKDFYFYMKEKKRNFCLFWCFECNNPPVGCFEFRRDLLQSWTSVGGG